MDFTSFFFRHEFVMCGVLAILSGDGPITPAQRRAAARMNDTMTARGPDGHGTYVRDGVLLAHRRLAIRDLDAGHQPMLTPDGRYAISYNGEIYNDEELRHELSCEHGVQFQTRCDSETLLYAYAAWGKNCVDRLQGMFAFVAVDYAHGDVLIARDRCGVKPIFYTQVGHSLLVASSIAALLEHPGVARQPNFRAISHYLSSFRLTLGHETMYENIFQLESANRMMISRRGIELETYWELPVEDATIPFEAAVAELSAGLDDAVERRQVSDRPVGMLLSGGVDSASIASSMSQNNREFFACSAGLEIENAAETAKTVGCELASVDPGANEFRDAWHDVVVSSRLPASTPSDPMILLLARSLKERVDVVLGGEGADEMLCGYAAQHWAGEDFNRHGTDSFRDSIMRSYGRDQFRSPVDLFLAGNSFLRREMKPSVLSMDAWRAAQFDEGLEPVYDAATGNRDGEDASRKIYRMIHRINLEGQLSRLDTATMMASLEARVPFTDHRLSEQMARVSFDKHIRLREGVDTGGTAMDLAAGQSLDTKRVLRTVAGLRLPKPIANRPKQSFPTPVFGWMAGPWEADVKDTLRSSPFLREVIHPERLPQFADDPSAAGVLLWPLMNLAAWGDREFAA